MQTRRKVVKKKKKLRLEVKKTNAGSKKAKDF